MATKLPASFRKYVARKITSKFREAVELVSAPMPQPGPKDVIVRNRYVGINASDVNHTAGRYDPTVKPPFDVGFEAVGEVVAAGGESNIKVGQPVAYMNFGAFAEYKLMPAHHAIPVPSVQPEFVALIVSGLTAAISLDKVGEIKKGETVLVTAAAGGTGQFAVQVAKNAGCHVIGTCSSQEKVEFLRSIGCDRPVNYKEERLADVLKKEYPKGVDVVYESIGGDMFATCLKNLAQHGRLVIIGFISGYTDQSGFKSTPGLAISPRLLTMSSSIRGFFLNHFFQYAPEYIGRLATDVASGTIKSVVDNGRFSPNGPFLGIERIPDAVEYLYDGKNVGKIVVELPHPPSSNL